ncbi:PPK2 family polyphosphate kinase [Bifidobacterium aquikefiricola]|uniref:Polyphosphate kinase 2 family protein n=1 Tax=Bifidobacterium aquikefiricola TaxID=3059038 RepID=A0AB39U4K4_9BIFI
MSSADKKFTARQMREIQAQQLREQTRHHIGDQMRLVRKESSQLSSIWDVDPDAALKFHAGLDLGQLDCGSTPGFEGRKADAKEFVSLSSGEISSFQEQLYANGVKGSRRRILIILQGMDTSGKGSMVEHVFRQTSPMGIHYHGFAAPTDEERNHDFLWRIRRELPKDGWISIFDRSQYEDIVMPRIYGTYPRMIWESRYGEINDFEHRLADDGCSIIKIFLSISKDFQKKRFLKRLDDPTKYWKFDPSDLKARSHWDDYMHAWQEVMERTSTDYAPWHVVPANHRWYSRAALSQILRARMQEMNLAWPPADFNVDEVKQELLD